MIDEQADAQPEPKPLTHDEMWEHYAGRGARQVLREMETAKRVRLDSQFCNSHPAGLYNAGAAVAGVFTNKYQQPRTVTMSDIEYLTLQNTISTSNDKITRLNDKITYLMQMIADLQAELCSQSEQPKQRLSETWEHLSDIITPTTPLPNRQTPSSNTKSPIPLTALRQQRQTIGLITEHL